MKKIIILTLLISLLTGCSYVSLNDLAIANTIGIDYDNNTFYLTAQIKDIKNSNGITENKSIIYESEGKTIAESIRNFQKKYPKNIYFGHLEIIIIGENGINKIDNILDYFVRSPEARANGYILATKNIKAKNILKEKNNNEETFQVENIKSEIQGLTKRTGLIKEITLEDFLQTYLTKGIDPVIPIIDIEKKDENIDNKRTIIKGLAPIKKGKLLEILPKKESIAFTTINNSYDDIVITPTYKNNKISTIIYNPKSNIKTKQKENKIDIEINIKIESKTSEINKKIDLSNKKTNDEIEKLVKKELKNYIKNLINYCKTNNIDILGIENNIYKNNRKEYLKYKKENYYKENIKINIKNSTYRNGSIEKGAL